MAKLIGFDVWFPNDIRKNSDWKPEHVQSFNDHLKRELVDLSKHGRTPGMDDFSFAQMELEQNDPFLGAVERRIAPPDMPSYVAEIEASRSAIQKANINPKEIGAVFTYSFANDHVSIGSAPIVAKELGIDNAIACEINAACSSHLTQLIMAAALVDSGKMNYVLLANSNFMSRGLQMGHPASPGVGDCGAAMIVGPDLVKGHKILNTYANSNGDYWNAVLFRRASGDNPHWYEPGGAFYVGSNDHNKARQLVQLTATNGAETIQRALNQVALSISDIDFLISIQPRKWIPKAIANLLGLDDNQTLETYEKYAHLGCCGPVVNLVEAETRGLLNSGDIVAMYSQGAGFTKTATIIKW